MRSPKLMIPALAAVAAIAAFYFLVLSPKRDEATKLDADIAAQQQQADQARALLTTYEDAKARYKTNYATVARLGKAVPADDDIRSLLVQLTDAADKSKVAFHQLNLGQGAAPAPGSTGAAAGSLAPTPGAVPIGSAGFRAMSFNFGFEGSFLRLSDFFNRLEDFVTVENKKLDVTGRLLLIGSISVTPVQGTNRLTANVGATSYLVPPATGVNGTSATGAAATAAPGATSPTTPASGTTPPTVPTATITGVR